MFTLYDDRYGYDGTFNLLRCRECDHEYLSGQLPASLSELYTQFYPRSDFDIEAFRPHSRPSALVSWLNGGMSSAFRWVPERVRVLDIGCGMGETLGYHAFRECEAHGVDADANVLRVGERFGYNVRTGVFDPSNYQPEYFDYVTMDQVIEHVPNPGKTLADVSRVMKDNGTCVLSTPNANGWGARIFGRRWLHWHVPYHLHFFSPESIRLAATEAGLSVERVMTITRSEWILYQILHLIMYPEQGHKSDFWNTGRERSFAQRLLLRSIMAMRFTLLPQVVTRVFDALGLGDNYVFMLKKTGNANT